MGLSQAVRQRFLIPPSQVRSLEPQPICMENLLYKIPEALRIYRLLNPKINDQDTCTQFVGGCVRDLILAHEIKDIDLATILEPDQVIDILSKENIKTNIKAKNFGVVTACINKHVFEITTLRKDLSPDGRYSKVEFIKDWNLDSQRRDFTINSIYCRFDSQDEQKILLFDPLNGRQDLLDGKINFISDAKISIQEDYVRALRYFRFFYMYSKCDHEPYILDQIFSNKEKIKKLSQNRLNLELKKIIFSKTGDKILNNSDVKNFFYYIYPNFFEILNSKNL